MKTGYQRRAAIDDVAFVADEMRPEDVAEVLAQSGHSPREALLFCFFMSKPCMIMVGRKENGKDHWANRQQEEQKFELHFH